MTPKLGDTITVWFSCGAASAVAAKLTIEKYPDCDILIVNNPVKEEDSDNLRFLNDVSSWLGKEILFASNHKFPDNSAVSVWGRRKYMSGTKGAPCTQVLKKEARYQFELANKIDWHVLGFTAEEKARHDQFIKYERGNLLPVLVVGQFEYLSTKRTTSVSSIMSPVRPDCIAGVTLSV